MSFFSLVLVLVNIDRSLIPLNAPTSVQSITAPVSIGVTGCELKVPHYSLTFYVGVPAIHVFSFSIY